MIWWLVLVFLSAATLAEEKKKCNGFAELCDLKLHQVTLPGSHRSAAGFDSHLRYHTKFFPMKVLSCYYRHQSFNAYRQLDLGIRYFDLQVCWEDQYKPTGAWLCNGKAYSGSLIHFFDQVDRWMNEPRNRNEVIALHFGDESSDKDSLSSGNFTVQEMIKRWMPLNEDHSGLDEQKLKIQLYSDMKLGEAVEKNHRIYVFMAEKLLGDGDREPWLMNDHSVGSIHQSMGWAVSRHCARLAETMAADYCNLFVYHKYLKYDFYLDRGLCTHHLAGACRFKTMHGAQGCFNGTILNGKTVNFISVDYAGQEVVKVAGEINRKNIKLYLGKNV